MSFPQSRLRRLRKSENLRRLTAEVNLSADDLLYPIFVKEGLKKKKSIPSLPGQHYYALGDLCELVEKCEELKIPGLLVFGIPEKKDEIGSEAFHEEGVVQSAVREIKKSSGLAVFTDVCLCHYTLHGHCGVLGERGVDNDKTLELLSRVALSHARAGADFVAPSSMMDGQVAAIRRALDENGFKDVGIMSYSSKFSSSLYGPFRDAAHSAPKATLPHLSDRRTYQMDFRSKVQAMREIELDIEEGADIVMIKPALPYLDIISSARKKFNVPIAAYQVSGEYVMIKLLSESGAAKEKDVFFETLTSIKRSGADFIITYAALDVARWLRD
jgi:porphobilinogen synthase